MRCDYPMGFDEDYLEPACEIFFPLFPQIIEVNEENVGGYESDDNFSFPSLHTISDDSFSLGETSGDDGEAEMIPAAYQFEDSDMEDIFNGNPIINIFDNEASSESFEPELIHSPRNPQSEASSDSFEPILIHSPGNPQSEVSNDESSELELIHSSQNPQSEASSDSFEPYVIHSPQNPQTDGSFTTTNCQDHENSDISNVSSHETDACAIIPSNVSPIFEESSQTDTSLNNSIISPPNTYVSLYVVVPPTSFPNASDNLLSEVPSGRLLSDTKPNNSLSPSLCGSDNGNIPLQNESLYTVNKICNNSEELPLDGTAVSSSISVTGSDMKCHSLPGLCSELDIKNGVSSDSKSENVVFYDNPYPESVVLRADLYDEINTNQDENASCDVISDKSVTNLKRKVANSVDDDLINKVPKCSVSHESNESVNEIPLVNYCKELSIDEMPILCKEDNIDIVPSTVNNTENVTLPLGKAVKENSITSQRKDL